ncbi:hypothetical protein B0H67DRAFT_493393 [Lasiosphaeris hirsuta]|uniref:Uncharacterized protein n=1 Tax=Lasiosphaeris hirsuta TaxID=260670 RepID=A0AA40A8K8_9PEZI|nr:hypothetical protein B0H67DRAFT_493393 [Lasiosphaeris hirsuta]
MDRHIPHDYTTSNVLAWTATQSANVEPSAEEDASADADEPPDSNQLISPIPKQFTRAPVRRNSEHQESLLTKALQSQSDEEAGGMGYHQRSRRRRSITSNFSLSSAAELTCDTGITTPARTSSPSPRLPDVGFVPIVGHGSRLMATTKASDAEALEKKRCISFACAAKPKPDDKSLMPPPPKPSSDAVKPQNTPRKACIVKFACPSRPFTRSGSPQQSQQSAGGATSVPQLSLPIGSGLRKSRSPASRSFRSLSHRRSSQSPVSHRSKTWLTANSTDLQSECSRFHEFASDEPQEDDWILRDDTSSKPKLTINDTLRKENAIRKLGKEAEEEADQEEEEENEDECADGDDGDNADDNNEDEEEESERGANEAESEYGWDDEASDGYKTDNEVGFADSDEEDDDDLVLWTTRAAGHHSSSGVTAVYRRPSVGEHSDSSDCARRIAGAIRAKKRQRHLAVRAFTPELPDSTDFVCGTLDEDRPLEEAYISHLTARKQGKLQLIPQDIDPSFPTSEPEDEAEELYKKGHGDSDENIWLHGELEDIHHERAGRRKKSDGHSPKRCRSPPPKPKRHHSPPPKTRGRSPRRLFDQHSPRRLRSPPPLRTLTQSPATSPIQLGGSIAFKSLAFRPGLTHTKSLPRGPVLFPHLKTPRRSRTNTVTRESHIRGAIDIVKGLEQKRQRRREKFYQKYCNRARKEKAQVKRPPPGQGAERMREVGLIMAGKLGQGNYVLSI